MRKSNYDKFPSTRTDGMAIVGWEKIVSTLNEQWADEPIWAIDLYTGTYEEDFLSAFAKTGRRIIDTRSLMRPEEEIRQFTERFITDDVLFGYMSNVKLEEYFDSSRVQEFKDPRALHHHWYWCSVCCGKVLPQRGSGEGVPRGLC